MLKCITGKPSNQEVVFAKPPQGLPASVWEKEFSVLFNGHKPVGIGFVAASTSQTPHGAYTCVVEHVIHDKVRSNHAFDHNEHCYLSCDLKRVIIPGLVVRGINDTDMRDVSFDLVVAKVKTAKRPVLITFADPSSRDVSAPQDDAPSEVENTAKLKDEIVDLRARLEESTRQRDEALEQLALYTKWNDALLATNGEIDAKTKALHEQIAAERAAADAKHAKALELQHERDHAANKLHELTVEHKSMAARADDLHTRLEAAQRAKRDADAKVAALERARLEDMQAIEALRREIHDEEDETSELDKLLIAEEQQVALAVTADAAQKHMAMVAAVKKQRQDHTLHKRDLEAKLAEYAEHMEHAKGVIAALEGQRQELALQLQIQVTPPAVVHPWDQPASLAAEKPDLAAWAEEKKALEATIAQLETQLQTEKAIEASLNATVTELSSAEHAREARAKAKELVLQRFMTQLSTTGILVQKHGRMGSAHPRFLYADAAGHWLSWMRIDDAKKEGAFQHPRKATTIELKLIVDILPGKQTHVFHRTSTTPADRCFSLICAKPCRTIDMETETPEQCQRLIQGFRLIRQAFLEKGGV
ncbi:hypothetical protein ACHHYP_03211 [Achlya hypogyna]|uniref:Uncharacterized protein n=1 Tax=Achlya hypogyna TaxID=1202772 RepID=A0A1V9Z466_ACHHY|nr:hypothetical protein ACHHYP_03211 [Achlya hypogyna]